jgi:hypothetical protein
MDVFTGAMQIAHTSTSIYFRKRMYLKIKEPCRMQGLIK